MTVDSAQARKAAKTLGATVNIPPRRMAFDFATSGMLKDQIKNP